MADTWLEHLNITVRDIDRTTRFLLTALSGWRVRGGGRMEWFGKSIAWRHVGDDTFYLALQDGGEGEVMGWQNHRLGPKHVGLVVPSTTDVVERLAAAGYPLDHWGETAASRRSAYIVDPDSVQFEFVEYLSDDPERRNSYEIERQSGRTSRSAGEASSMPPSLDSIDHVHVSVVDRVAAENWYVRVLGLTRVKELEFWAPDGGPLTIRNREGTIHLALFEGVPENHRSRVAFGVGAEAFIRWKSHLGKVLDVAPEAEDHAVSWSLYFDDPDGNPYEVTSYAYESIRRDLATAEH